MSHTTKTARTSVTRYGIPLYPRIPAIKVHQATKATISVVVRDDEGKPKDLRPFGVEEFQTIGHTRIEKSSSSASSESSSSANETPAVVVARLAEAIDLNPTEFPCYVMDAQGGVIEFDLLPEDTSNAGIFVGEIILKDGTDLKPEFIYRFYVEIEGTLLSIEPTGPPSVMEIRLHLRDSAPDENFLIDELDFDLAEISLAIVRPVMFWNEALPPITYFTTATFPFRYHWLEGIVSQLFFMAAEHYRRNRLAHQAGGTAVDDMNKEREYQVEGMRRWDAFKAWVQSKKISFNIDGVYSELGSTYGGGWGY